MFKKEMWPILDRAKRYNVTNICTFRRGYDGADMLKMHFRDKAELVAIRQYCKDLDIQTSVKPFEHDKSILELNCIFDLPAGVYGLK